MSTESKAAGEEHRSASDEELVRQVLDGHKEAYRDLVLRYQHYVKSMMVRQIGNTAIAEELTQEILLKAYVHLRSFRFEAKFATWLSRIAVNHAAKFFASRRYRQMLATDGLDQAGYEAAAADPVERQERAEQFQTLQYALVKLPPKLRAVLVLCGLEGKSYEEATEILGLSIGTVRSRLHRARLRLKDELCREKTAEGAYEA